MNASVIWPVVLRLALAGIMLAAALAKLASPDKSRASLAGYGIHSRRAQHATFGSLVAFELALAAGLAAGWHPAAWGGLALALAGAATTATLIARGQSGRPCPCFGARSRIGLPALARDGVLAAGMAALILAPAYQPTRDEWFAIGLAAALLLCGGLALAVAALAREVGMLRMRVGPSAALEIPEEGPALGSQSPLAARFSAVDGELLLAVFSSPACRVCEALSPAIDSIAGAEGIEVKRLDELEAADAWIEAEVPGSPYAVAMDAAGVVLAKGTFNNLAQLEGLVGTAISRSGENASRALMAHG